MTHAIEIATDLRGLFGAVRDQGSRPTCLAFAASDTHAGLRDGWTALSCEFAFYHAQRRAGRPPTHGALLKPMLEALCQDGQPGEDGWPYLTVIPSDHSQWTPPATVGALFGRAGMTGAPELDLIISTLDSQRPLMVLTKLSQSFYKPDADGVVHPIPGEQPNPSLRHAVVAVGHGTVDRQTAILVRNSWGASWGVDGHAWLTEAFLKPRIFGTAILMEDVNVSCHSSAV
jgi:Papain family cysteine protease